MEENKLRCTLTNGEHTPGEKVRFYTDLVKMARELNYTLSEFVRSLKLGVYLTRHDVGEGYVNTPTHQVVGLSNHLQDTEEPDVYHAG